MSLGGKIISTILGFGFIVFIAVMFLCTTKIPAGYVGCQYSMSGGIKDEVLTQGWHLVSPTIHVTEYTVGLETSYLTSSSKGDSEDDESFEASSSEGKAMTLEMTYNYQFDPDKVTYVFTRFKGQSGKEVRDSFIKPNIISWTKEVVARYKVADILGEKRASINETLSEYLAQKFEQYGIIVSNASLINIEVDEKTQEAINNKIQATQNAETQAINNQTAIDKATADATVKETNAKANAEAVKIAADAEAEANKKVSESITKELIEYEKIQKWNGELSKVSGSSATIVDVGTVMEEETVEE